MGRRCVVCLPKSDVDWLFGLEHQINREDSCAYIESFFRRRVGGIGGYDTGGDAYAWRDVCRTAGHAGDCQAIPADWRDADGAGAIIQSVGWPGSAGIFYRLHDYRRTKG